MGGDCCGCCRCCGFCGCGCALEGIACELSGYHGVKDLDVVSQGDGNAEDVGQDEVGGEEGEKREEEGETGEEVDAQEGPEREDEREGIEGLEEGTKEEEFSI